jgi:signal transduction histidine kinase
LIDDLGFAAAAKWYAQGFSERSGIKINLQLANESQRLPRTVELPLFRILQASLSNVHRHAESTSVDVHFGINGGEAKLEVKDHGKGINPELLGRLNDSGAGAGIGLAGMRERLRELGGRLEIESDKSGTLIRAVIPSSAFTGAKKPEPQRKVGKSGTQ